MTLSNTFKTLSMSGTVADTAVQIGTRGPQPRELTSAFSVHTLSMLVTVVEALDIVHTEYGGHLPLTPVVRVERAGWAGPGREGRWWVGPGRGRDGGRDQGGEEMVGGTREGKRWWVGPGRGRDGG